MIDDHLTKMFLFTKLSMYMYVCSTYSVYAVVSTLEFFYREIQTTRALS